MLRCKPVLVAGNVSVNLFIVTKWTMREGVDAHVCELQLGLKVIDKLKDAEGHARYVKFRNH